MRISDWSSDVCSSDLRLGELTSRYPALQLDCAMTDWQRDMVEDRLDLALRVGPVGDDRLVVHPLGRLPRLLVARPAYLAARGMPASAEDLARKSTRLNSSH